MMGLYDTGDIPFRTVYLHGLVRDEKGDKMSKIRGNVLNPIDTLERYGTDALRFALTTGTSPGNDVKLSTSRLEAGRNFANKLWNATRFIVRSIESDDCNTAIQRSQLPREDRWILSRLSRTISGVSAFMEDFQFGEAQKQIYEFLWGDFCDWYIEIAKIRLRSGEGAPSPVPVLVHVLDTALRLLHPYMPFITEELWQNLKRRLPSGWQAADSVMIADYPQADNTATDPEAEQVMEAVIDIVHSIRNARAQNKVESSRWIEAHIYAERLSSAITPYSEVIQTLARVKPISFPDRMPEGSLGENALVLVLKESQVIIPMESMIDPEAERKRLGKEIEQVQAMLAQLELRLKDEAFLNKAPAAVIAKERQKLTEGSARLEKLKEQLERFQA